MQDTCQDQPDSDIRLIMNYMLLIIKNIIPTGRYAIKRSLFGRLTIYDRRLPHFVTPHGQIAAARSGMKSWRNT